MATDREILDAQSAKALDQEWPPDNLFMARFLVLLVLYSLACCVAAIAVVGALHHAVEPSFLRAAKAFLAEHFSLKVVIDALLVTPIFATPWLLPVRGLSLKQHRDKLAYYATARGMVMLFWFGLTFGAIVGLVRRFEFLLRFGDLEDIAVVLARAMATAFVLVFLVIVTSFDLRSKT